MVSILNLRSAIWFAGRRVPSGEETPLKLITLISVHRDGMSGLQGYLLNNTQIGPVPNYPLRLKCCPSSFLKMACRGETYLCQSASACEFRLD
jgi:hypothetical protein